MTADKPVLENIVEMGAKSIRNAMRVQIPCKVLEYDETQQRVTIQPLILFSRLDVNDKRDPYLPEPIAGVPVAFFSGGDFSLTFPIAVGQQGMALFADRSLDEWLATGNDNITPADPRRFDINDAVFFPGVVSFATPIPSAGIDSGAMVLRAPRIELRESGPTDFVTLEAKVQAELSKILTLLQTWTVVPADGGLALKTAALLLSIAPTAATKVKAE